MSADLPHLHRGHTPLLISLPHVGTHIPGPLQPRYTERALQVEDTDWFLDRLYAFAGELGASLLVPRLSRYLIDLNRPSDQPPMYAGQNNTELCPTRHFTGEPIYRPGQAPDEAEIRAACDLATGSPTTMPWPPNWRGCARSTATRCSSTRTASRANCPGCSKARCRT
jgi:N-formylglutamate amidohydrolase